MRIELLSKPGCHLCDDAKQVVARVCQALHQPWSEINIEDIPHLFERYHEEIPVLLIDGMKKFKYRIDEKRLHTLLSRGK